MTARLKVLSLFRSLHRTRKAVFRGDDGALTAGRHRINEEFKKNANETDPGKVDELLVLAENSEKVLRTTVVQGQLRKDGVYELVLTKDTALEENTVFDIDADLPFRGKRKKCSDSDSPESKG